MTNKELLEKAAKAAGIEIEWTTPYVALGDFVQVPNWNPLTDDGDALRLAVKLNLNVYCSTKNIVKTAYPNQVFAEELKQPDPYAATRRAIVRAAAEIGKGNK